jgi:L-amino acid N-acyltransferase YncA
VIRLANADDAAAICAIYNRYVLNTTISFEDTTVRAPAMAERIALLYLQRVCRGTSARKMTSFWVTLTPAWRTSPCLPVFG